MNPPRDALDLLNHVLAAELCGLADEIAAERELNFNGHVCEHGRNLDCELCERCADDDAELDAL